MLFYRPLVGLKLVILLVLPWEISVKKKTYVALQTLTVT